MPRFQLSILLGLSMTILQACGGGGQSTPPPQAIVPPPVMSGAPQITGPGTDFVGKNDGSQTLNVLIIRAEFSDTPINISNDQWNNMWIQNLQSLQNYMTQYAYNEVDVSATISSAIILPPSAGFFNENVIPSRFRAAYREIAAISDDDDVATIDNADVVIFNYPSIEHSRSFGGLGSPGNIWLPGNDVFDGALIHEMGHHYGMPHSQGMEGVTFRSDPSTHRLITNDFTEGFDGLHMIGSDGNGRTGFFAPYPVPYMVDSGLMPEIYRETITADGTYRLFDFEQPRLPDTADKMAYVININNENLWMSFSPNMVERWSQFGSDGFSNGMIMHRRYNQNEISVIDFTPNSYRQANAFSQADHDFQLFQDSRDGALQVGETFEITDTTGASPRDIIIEPIATGTERGMDYIDIRVSGL